MKRTLTFGMMMLPAIVTLFLVETSAATEQTTKVESEDKEVRQLVGFNVAGVQPASAEAELASLRQRIQQIELGLSSPINNQAIQLASLYTSNAQAASATAEIAYLRQRIQQLELANPTAQMPRFASVPASNNRLASSEAELASLRHRIQQLELEAVDPTVQLVNATSYLEAGPVESEFDGACVCGPSWEAGFELAWLRPHFPAFDNLGTASLLFNNPIVPANTTQIAALINAGEIKDAVSPRFWLTYWIDSCTGVRASYWHFANSSRTGPVNGIINNNGAISAFTNSLSLGIDVDQVDLEMFREWQLGGTNVLLSTGVRYLSLQRDGAFNFTLVTPGPGGGPPMPNILNLDIAASTHLEGFGPTFSIETSRVWNCWRPFINFRFTVMPGDSFVSLNVAEQDNFGGAPSQFNLGVATSQEHLLLASQFELQFGTELKRDTPYGELFARAAMDLQYWVTAVGGLTSTGIVGNADTGGLSFVGGLFSIGIRR